MFYWASLSAHNHTGCIPSSFTALFVSERCPYRCQPLYKISRLPGLRASAWWSPASGMDSFLRCPLHHPLGSWDGWLASGCAALTSACSLLLQALLLSTLFAPSARLSHLIGAKEVPRETEGSVNVKEPTLERANVFACVVRVFECVCVCSLHCFAGVVITYWWCGLKCSITSAGGTIMPLSFIPSTSQIHTHPHTHVFMLLVKIATCSSHRSLVCICIHDATVKCWFPGFLTGFSKMAKTVRNRAKEVKLLHHSSFHWIIGIKDLHYSGRVRERSPLFHQPLHRQTLCPCLLLNHPWRCSRLCHLIWYI